MYGQERDSKFDCGTGKVHFRGGSLGIPLLKSHRAFWVLHVFKGL